MAGMAPPSEGLMPPIKGQPQRQQEPWCGEWKGQAEYFWQLLLPASLLSLPYCLTGPVTGQSVSDCRRDNFPGLLYFLEEVPQPEVVPQALVPEAGDRGGAAPEGQPSPRAPQGQVLKGLTSPRNQKKL